MLLPAGDALSLSRTEEAASDHLFSITAWEAGNVGDKWIHRARSFFRRNSQSGARGQGLVDEYFRAVDRIARLEGERNRAESVAPPDSARVAALDGEIARLRAERLRLRDDVEELLESAISATLKASGLGAAGGLVWPPVDFRLDAPPKVLITSPRDRIERLESVLLDAAVTPGEADAIEARILKEQNLSALVEGLGGLATYPTFVKDDYQLRTVLETAAHEWVHAYLFFYPLGQHYNAGNDMLTLNETVADVAGRELGDATYEALTGVALPTPTPASEAGGQKGTGAFTFDSFMRETRLRTDELLAEGRIEDAERYMEDRRIELQSHGYYLRKINQAYFAFHGSYADRAVSVSPIGREVKELRAAAGSIGEFIRAVRGVNSYEAFQKVLAARKQRPQG